MARHALAVLLAVLAVGAIWVWVRPAPVASLHVSGDGADAVRALVTDLPGVPEAGAARVEAVLLRRPENAEYVSGLAGPCTDICAAQAVTVFLRLRPGRVRKVVVVNLEAMGGGASLDAGGALMASVADCAARVLRAEQARLRARAPDCAGGGAGGRRQVIVPPWRL